MYLSDRKSGRRLREAGCGYSIVARAGGEYRCG